MADSEQPAAETAASASPNLGQILRDARVAKDLTIEQIATELRIEARQLAALEDNRFEQIGVPVFVKGYVRQYAQRLGLDQRSLMEMYGRQAKLEEVQIQPSKTIKLRDERQITVWVVSVLVLLLIAVGLAVWWMNGGNFELG
ncbi:MAG TPA: helix-turn-helix transcriptional regulator, partial [Gammaproteobacteria bacterium]|nr:helix-turn-helix transcriptional regulator [Gammaproteobacteria bacterium]